MVTANRKEQRIAWRKRVFDKIGDSMENGSLRLSRDVTTNECDWLEEDLTAGTIVYAYTSTMGCISMNGWGVTRQPQTPPFFELPLDAIEAVTLTYDNPPFEMIPRSQRKRKL